ncbi:MAG: hypothetical protein AAGD05_09325, partial [Bacteroidota bacterium]
MMNNISFTDLEAYFPQICDWAQQQEQFIIRHGVPLSPDQQIDAYQIGVQQIKQVRLLKVDQMPSAPLDASRKHLLASLPLLSSSTIGLTFRYGIYIRADHWGRRSLVIHELVHTRQYEQLGGFSSFLKQ